MNRGQLTIENIRLSILAGNFSPALVFHAKQTRNFFGVKMGHNHATVLCVANAGIHNAATTTKLVLICGDKSFQCATDFAKKVAALRLVTSPLVRLLHGS